MGDRKNTQVDKPARLTDTVYTQVAREVRAARRRKATGSLGGEDIGTRRREHTLSEETLPRQGQGFIRLG